MTIFGAIFLASVVLTSCTDDKKDDKKKERVIDLKDLDKGIEKEEDAVKSLLKLGEAQIKVMEACKGPMEEIANLKDRVEEIREAMNDVGKVMIEEKFDFEDLLEDDDMKEMDDKVRDLRKELQKLNEDMDIVLRNLRN